MWVRVGSYPTKKNPSTRDTTSTDHILTSLGQITYAQPFSSTYMSLLCPGDSLHRDLESYVSPLEYAEREEDCSGVRVQSGVVTKWRVKRVRSVPGDVIISEVLSAPWPVRHAHEHSSLRLSLINTHSNIPVICCTHDWSRQCKTCAQHFMGILPGICTTFLLEDQSSDEPDGFCL